MNHSVQRASNSFTLFTKNCKYIIHDVKKNLIIWSAQIACTKKQLILAYLILYLCKTFIHELNAHLSV